jgi:hypothetical protein
MRSAMPVRRSRPVASATNWMMAPSSGKSAGGAIWHCFPTFSICWPRRRFAQPSRSVIPCLQPAIASSSARLCIARYFACTNSFTPAGKPAWSIPQRFRRIQNNLGVLRAHTFALLAASSLVTGSPDSASSPSCQSGACSSKGTLSNCSISGNNCAGSE